MAWYGTFVVFAFALPCFALSSPASPCLALPFPVNATNRQPCSFLPLARLPVIFNDSLGNRFDQIRRLFGLA